MSYNWRYTKERIFAAITDRQRKRGGERKMKMLHMVAFTLVVVGAVNWGLVGLADFNLVNMLLGSMPMLERLVYILVGASGVILAATHMKDCKTCAK